MALRNRAPAWFWIVAGAITLWALIGVLAFYNDATMTPASARAQGHGDYDLKLLASRPTWFLWLYAVAIFSGLFGGVALLLRSVHARGLFIVSLAAMVVQFGWVFVATDILAVKGILVAAGFPVFLIVVAAVQVWFAALAQRRGWIA